MFPCGHACYSLLSCGESATNAHLVGAVLPDAAVTGAFGWSDLHQVDNVRNFAASIGHIGLTPMVEGIRQHLELDARSHDHWRSGGGYAYEIQTDELRSAVARACGVDGELVRTLSHNFVETAVDLHVLAVEPGMLGRLRKAFDECDTDVLAAQIVKWQGGDAGQISTSIRAYFELVCAHDGTTIDGMVDLWADLFESLQATTFDWAAPQSLDRGQAERAIEIDLTLTESQALAVVTP